MTLEQALDTIKNTLANEDMILTIQFNTADQWFSANLIQRGSADMIAEEENEGSLEDAIKLIAEQLEGLEGE